MSDRVEPGAKEIREAPRGLPGLLRNIGPGVVVSGSVVGSGELLVTTRMGAEVGFVFLWGIIVACLVKFFIQVELGRQCVLHNQTTIQALDRIAGFRFRNTSWVAWLCSAGYLGVMLALVGILGAVAGLMNTVFDGISKEAWALPVVILLSILLWRGLYNDLEKMVTFLVAAFSLIVIGSVLMLQATEHSITGRAIAIWLSLCHASRRGLRGAGRDGVSGSHGCRAVHVSLLDPGKRATLISSGPRRIQMPGGIAIAAGCVCWSPTPLCARRSPW